MARGRKTTGTLFLILILLFLMNTVLVGGVWVGVASANPIFLGTSGGVTAGGGASCQVTPYVSASGAEYVAAGIGADANSYYRGGIIQTGTTKTVCAISARLSLGGGSITGKTLVLRVWTMSGNDLGSEIATSSGVTGSDAWSGTDVTFTLISNVELAGTTTYAVTLDMGEVDGTNYATLRLTDEILANWGSGRWQSNGANTAVYDYDAYMGFFAYE